MNNLPDHICIVGSGTAGWLAALMLQDTAKRTHQNLRLTVVESSKIGTIGVGEGTTAIFRQMLQHLGIDEMEFIRETGATIKYGIRHKDWRNVGHSYDGPIDDLAQIAGQGLADYAVASGRPVSEAHLFQHLINRNRSPFAQKGNRIVPAGPYHHAFHFDQAKAGAFLRAQARDVTIIDDQVTEVVTGGAGITALVLESGQTVAADFYLDCTGFRRALIGSLGAEWISFADVLPINRAMPFWIDISEGEEIPPVTLAHAQSAGWMWKIPTQERYGCGYVYSDVHISPEQAKAEIEETLGHPIEVRNDIKIEAGRLSKPWIGNCVAVGLASSFLEPLEATSIHGTIVQLMWLSQMISEPNGANRYNSAHAGQVDDFRDFIRLHYVSERRDSAFWRDIAASHPKHVTDRTTQWRSSLPKRGDFAAVPMNMPHVQEQLYTPVLDGLGLFDRAAIKAQLSEKPKHRAQLRKAHAAIASEYARAAGQCMPHRAFLNSLKQETVT
ncbi:tryptophan halogenase family protein [Sulfitobacter mediterraneus]|uniref:tryptophan halogenase family protein n=1 Tax=Sulfitobacter mediterraneus TaxID=83219 RepID=UPI0021A8C259|nr:tryptophan halogenase family protein [Sulfitobacter mediterraneus]UWR13419.1 tryptophan 7-halogenase [Sulfitobacter mediterraneus]